MAPFASISGPRLCADSVRITVTGLAAELEEGRGPHKGGGLWVLLESSLQSECLSFQQPSTPRQRGDTMGVSHLERGRG